MRVMADASPPVPAAALDSLRRDLPRLATLADEAFAVDARFSSGGTGGEAAGLLKDLNRHFGLTLLAVLELGLRGGLEAEFEWLAAVLVRRGGGAVAPARFLEVWASVIHGVIEPSSAASLAAPVLELRRGLDAPKPSPPSSARVLDPDVDLFLGSLLRRDRRGAAEHALGLLRSRFASRFADAWSGLIAPGLREIGLRWEEGRLGAAGEHAATEIARYVVHRLSDALPKAPPLSLRALVACVEGEEHSLGAEALAELLALEGWAVLYTGRSAPLSDTLAFASDGSPEAVFLSVALVRNLPAARDLLLGLRKALPAAALVLGGAAARAARPVFGRWADAVAGDISEARTAASKRLSRDA